MNNSSNIKVRFKPTYEECKFCEGESIMHDYTHSCDKCRESKKVYDLLNTGTVVKCFGTVVCGTATIVDDEGNISVVGIDEIEVIKKGGSES